MAKSVQILKGESRDPRTAETVQIFKGESSDPRTAHLIAIFKGDQGIHGPSVWSKF